MLYTQLKKRNWHGSKKAYCLITKPLVSRFVFEFFCCYRNYSNLVRILIMQNSPHFSKNGVSNLVREGKNFRCFLPLILYLRK